MTIEELKGLDSQYVMQTYSRFPLAIDHGKGATVYVAESRISTLPPVSV